MLKKCIHLLVAGSFATLGLAGVAWSPLPPLPLPHRFQKWSLTF